MSSDVSNTFSLPPAPTGRVVPEGLSERSFRSVLVPLDGSRHAEHALPHALALVRARGGMLRIVQVYSYREEAFARNALWSEESPVQAIREPRERYLRDIVRRISRGSDVPVAATLMESDVPATLLQRLQGEADLTIMTSRRRHWLSRLYRESLVDSVLSRSERALLLVRGYDAPVDLTGDPLCRHLLVPIDHAEDFASLAGHWSSLCDIRRRLAVTLLPLSRRSAAAASSWVAGHGEVPPGLDVRVEPIPATTAQAVLDYAKNEDVDWMAVTLSQGPDRCPWTSSGLAQAIVSRSQIPVLVRVRHSRADASSSRDVVIADPFSRFAGTFP